MNKRFLVKVIKNYSRNKKRIEEIRRDIYGMSAIDYTKPFSSEKKPNDSTANMVHMFEIDKERIRLQNQINAVDRMRLRLDERQKKVCEEIIIKSKKAFVLESEGISERTVYRLKNEILYILNEELM